MGRREIIVTATIGLAGIFGAGLIAALLAPTIPNAHLIALACIAGFIVTGVCLLQMVLQAPKKSDQPFNITVSAAGLIVQDGKEFLSENITPTVLGEKIKNRTHVQIDAITSSYAGKWMRISGSVIDIVDCGPNWLVQLRDSDKHLWSASFTKEHHQKLLAINVGDRLTIVGEVKSLTPNVGLTSATIEHIDGPK